MIFHENRLPNLGKMSQNVSPAAFVSGALRLTSKHCVLSVGHRQKVQTQYRSGATERGV